MNKIKKTSIGITSLLMGLVLIRFAISKLAGWDISVAAFIEMAQPLGIDPTLFRLTTGVQIALLCLSYLATAIYSPFEHKTFLANRLNFKRLSLFANLFGFVTMSGALLAEFFLRVEPKWLLVYIASGIIIFSSINIGLIINKESILKLKSISL